MKKLFFLLSGALLLANLFVSTGCEDDPVEKLSPTVLVSGAPDVALEPGSDIAFSVDVTKGTDDLASMTITEDGVNVDATRITIENIDVANNPQLITDADKGGLVWNITIAGSDVEGTYSYEVTVADDGGLSDFDGFDVTIEKSGTPVVEQNGVLLNQAGPMGTGGLDLDNGAGTGSTDADAEIRDWGIDLALPVADNWVQKIGATDGNTMRVVQWSAEVADFDAAATVEEIAALWSTGTSITDNKSEVVIEGDAFVIENAASGRVYLIHIDEVNVTSDNNDDNYVISIKY